MWLLWRTFFLAFLNKHSPSGNIKIQGNNLPYITAEVRQLATQRDFFLRKMANKTSSKYFNPSFTKGGGVEPTPKGFSSITFDQNNTETSNFA